MKFTKCDYCKKIIKGNVFALVMSDTSSILPTNSVYFDICGECYKEFFKKLTDKEENEDGYTES